MQIIPRRNLSESLIDEPARPADVARSWHEQGMSETVDEIAATPFQLMPDRRMRTSMSSAVRSPHRFLFVRPQHSGLEICVESQTRYDRSRLASGRRTGYSRRGRSAARRRWAKQILDRWP